MHIVCPHCTAINRIPAGRSPLRGKCGSCHQLLFTGKAVELNEASFKRHLHGNGIPLVVDFWAQWCAPCQAMAPVFQRAAEELEPQVRFAKVNTESQPQLSASFHVRSIPTLILYRGGREAARLSGAMYFHQLVSWIRENLS
jgi:thioredoxin 2